VCWCPKRLAFIRARVYYGRVNNLRVPKHTTKWVSKNERQVASILFVRELFTPYDLKNMKRADVFGKNKDVPAIFHW
jgi:hypothetical protein